MCVPTLVGFVPKRVSVSGWGPAPLWLHRTRNAPQFVLRTPRPDPASLCPGKTLASLPPRASLRSMLQPLLTPRRDRWTRQGIACTGGTWLIPLAGLCLQPLDLTLPVPWRSPGSPAVSPAWCPSPWPLGTVTVLRPQGSAYFSRLLPSLPLFCPSWKEL